MTTASALEQIATALPTITAALSASGVPALAQVGAIGQALEGIVSSLQAAEKAQQQLAGISDPAELNAAVEVLLAQAEALNKASHGT